MRNGFLALVAPLILIAAFLVISPRSAEAHRCLMFKASHNGTDMFHPDGAIGTAKDKLLYAIDTWKREKRIKKLRIGKIKSQCGEWYVMYLLPHRTCTARARVCG